MNFKTYLLFITILFGGKMFSQTKSEPIIIGKTDILYSETLKENRTINIYLPPGFDAKDTIKYPVIYVLDGGVEEDFIHLVGLVRFNTQPWVARFPNSIVVGIETINRKKDFTFAVSNLDFIDKEGFDKKQFKENGGATAYATFLEKELIPFIEKNYNANKTRTVIGESLAGLFATHTLMYQPELFTNYIIISPSLWWGDEALLNKEHTTLLKNIKQKISVYIGAPKKKEYVKMYNEAKQLYKNMQGNPNIKSYFDYLPDELHSTVIHQAANNAFRKIYTKTTFSK